jgi:hypothetical protein
MKHQDLPTLDAGTFQDQLGQLAEVLAQKVLREAPKMLDAPDYVPVDMHVLIRQAIYTYALLFYLNADERRTKDCHWKLAYSVVALPLVRSMIDCLYNITTILQDPKFYGPWFRKSGFRKALRALEEDENNYSGKREWDEWLQKSRNLIFSQVRANQIDIEDIRSQRPWPTLGQYLNENKNAHQQFLSGFTYGPWREYSAMSHGAFEGLMSTGMYYVTDSFPHDDRPKVEASAPALLALHLGRAATILLCIITEVQGKFRFEGANINQRILEMWMALNPLFEAKELYDEHYSEFLSKKKISS